MLTYKTPTLGVTLTVKWSISQTGVGSRRSAAKCYCVRELFCSFMGVIGGCLPVVDL